MFKQKNNNIKETDLKLYPVWSNFIYFITSIYALMLSMSMSSRVDIVKKVLFFVYSIVILLTGTFSIIYHVNTPSWTGSKDVTRTEDFKLWLKLDQSFAIILVIYSLLLLLFRLIVHKFSFYYVLKLVSNPIFVLSVLFIILSVIFYCIAHNHYEEADDCPGKNNMNNLCFHSNLDSYDIFHSNWHIFTSIALIFWISLLYQNW